MTEPFGVDDVAPTPSRVEELGSGLRSAAVYAVCGALPRAVGLITLPLYTRVVPPDQYGRFSLLVTLSSAIAILFSLGLDVAVMRIYFQLGDDERRRTEFVNSVWIILMVVPLGAAGVLGIASWIAVGDTRFGGLDPLLALVGAATSVAATTVPFALLRAEQRLRDFVALTTVATVSNVCGSLLLVVGFRLGVRGWLIAAIASNVLTFLTAVRLAPFQRPKSVSRGPIREALRFGAPLVPHSLAHWALQVADRVVIAGIVSSTALGIYSLASNLGLPVLMLVQSLNYGFMPAYARAGAARKGSERDLRRIVVLQAGVVTLLCTSWALLAPPLVELVTPSTYGQAAPLVPWIALGYGFLGLYMIPMNGASLGSGRTTFVAAATLSAFAVNLGLLLAFVPSDGIKAAAVASAVAYAALLVATFLYASFRESPVEYRWSRLLPMFATAIAVYAVARVTTEAASPARSLMERTAWVCAATAIGGVIVPSVRASVLTLASEAKRLALSPLGR